MKEINVREINITDFNDIYILNQELGYLYPIEKVREKIRYIIEDTKDIILVVEKNNEIIGYIHGSPYELLYYDPIINILGLVVKEKYRNIGIGKVLMNSLECWAKEEGYSGIRLTSGSDRLDAHRFYEKQGYINKKDQKNFFKIFD